MWQAGKEMARMNKKLMLAALSGVMLAGCSGAVTNVSDADQSLMTIGDITYTKGQVYDFMKKSQGANLTMQMAENVIYDKEVPVTDEIREKAEASYNEYARDEDLSAYLQSMGYKDKQDYIDRVLIPSVQAEQLLNKWFDDDKDEIVAEYKPSKAQIIVTDSEDNANKALEALKDGKSMSDVYSQYGSQGTGYDGTASLVTTLDTSLPVRLINTLANAESKAGVVNEVFTSDSGTQYFVAVLVTNNYDDLKSDLISTLKNDSSVTDACLVYYLKKMDFKVYDQDIFNQLKINNPKYLVQRPDLAEESDN